MHPIFSRPSLAGVTALIAGLLAAFHISIAAADTLSDVQTLLQQGRLADAMSKVDNHIAAKPKDAQGRFLKGVILSEMGKPAEAIAVYVKLTQDYPTLPEPYNNLAVLYAQQKQYDKARLTLEMAFKTNPAYSTAHENLSDIYAQLASQSYDKALQRDSTNNTAQSQLSPIRELGGTASRPAPLANAAPAPAPTSVGPVVSTAQKAPDTKAKTTVQSTQSAPSHPVAVESSSENEVTRALQHWKSTWKRLDFTNALAYTISDLTCRIMREKVNSSGVSSSSSNPMGSKSGSAATGCRSEMRKSRFW